MISICPCGYREIVRALLRYRRSPDILSLSCIYVVLYHDYPGTVGISLPILSLGFLIYKMEANYLPSFLWRLEKVLVNYHLHSCLWLVRNSDK